MNINTVRLGLAAAAAMNIGGVLVFSRALSNSVINEFDPVVMSNFGLLMIMVWGLAYLGAATIKANITWLAGAFTLEKLVYVVVWVKWIASNSLSAVYDADLFAGIFYTIYGLNDFVFMLFFFFVFKSQWAKKD
ncbi:hypothetical protein ABT56_20825 [Photobacterium aquae]|uniref:Uncharacterized protein n=1 Tax=Photobacterium aquae TaxID=1195763 RepID=A0A0J1GPW5_9GAMM|nr:hypothetical protein [Photobacterium aquae]KLV01474.1 hypothetical protein ABT56_22220 [Photobacterium aquae]KLV03197.1 hypothetical protein ABT56_20825 [Photobacterium aquae]